MYKTFFIFFGAPGSGKGTEAQLIAEKYKLPVISTGDLLRQELKQQSALGNKAKSFMDKGKLVPSRLLEELIVNRLCKKDAARGAIFDGYPRKKEQQKFLLSVIKESKTVKSVAILIDVSDRAVLSRLSNRRACICGAIYNLKTKPPKKAGICDRDGKKLFVRDDDKTSVINDRLKIYHKDSAPLINYWRKEGKLIVVNGEQSIKDVDRQTKKELTKRGF